MRKKHFITMRDVFDGVINYLQTQEHPYGTIKPYKTALYRMQKYVGSPEMPYSTELTKQFMEKLSQQLSEGSVSRKTWYSTRRTVVMANEFYERAHSLGIVFVFLIGDVDVAAGEPGIQLI